MMMNAKRNRLAVGTIFLLSGWASLLSAQPYHFAGGTGEPNDPYLIYTPEQMNTIGISPANKGSHFRLMADLDLSQYTGTQFNIIGVDWNHRFTGVFDGNGHTISNFSYTTTSGQYAGLFGCAHAYAAEIKNLGLIDPCVTADGASNVGCLVGKFQGTMTNCYVRGGHVCGKKKVGGLVGENYYSGRLTSCYSTCVVDSTGDHVGGLVGLNSGTISDCYAAGSVNGQNYIGGLVGSNDGETVECYSTGAVTGNDLVGGLAGANHESITQCYSTGAVVAKGRFGGLVGRVDYGSSGSFWDIETSGVADSNDGQGCSSAQMRDPNTFIAAGWDFFGLSDGPSDVWAVDPETGFPTLWWQVPKEELPDLANFSGGSGTAEDPYLIASAEQLNSIGHNPRLMASHFKLVDDINLAGIRFYLVGSRRFPFTGGFDGNGKSISNFSYRSWETGDIGFFGRIDGANAKVQNLTLIDPNIEVSAAQYVGSLVGDLDYGAIMNCRVQGAHVSAWQDVGGLVGESSGTISNCFVEATVTGRGTVGGLAGRAWGLITNCHVGGIVTGHGIEIGGLVGGCAGTISSCSARCVVTGRSQIAGMAGFVQFGSLVNCYVSTGSVSGDSEVGGLVGFLNSGDVRNCYSICRVSGQTYTGGLVGGKKSFGNVVSSFWDVETSGQAQSNRGEGKTTAQMQSASTYLAAGWDFVGETNNGAEDIWWINDGKDYPHLRWESIDDDK